MANVELTTKMAALVFQEGEDAELYMPDGMGEDDVAPTFVIEAVMAMYFLTSTKSEVEKMREKVMDLILAEAEKDQKSKNA